MYDVQTIIDNLNAIIANSGAAVAITQLRRDRAMARRLIRAWDEEPGHQWGPVAHVVSEVAATGFPA